MAHVSRPMVALLVATLAFFALWTVALKPDGSTGNGGSQGLAGLSSAVAKAHHVVAASAAVSAAPSGGSATQSAEAARQTTIAAASPSTPLGGNAATVPPTTPGTATSPAASYANPGASSSSAAATGPTGASSGLAQTGVTSGLAQTGASATSSGPAALDAALTAHQIVVVLFYNPAGADDLAVKQELDSLAPTPGVVVLSAPITQLAAYSSITRRVPVSQAPTLLFIDRHGNASEIVGFADTLEVAQRLAATLAVK